jgi:hypothetical protein
VLGHLQEAAVVLDGAARVARVISGRLGEHDVGAQVDIDNKR